MLDDGEDNALGASSCTPPVEASSSVDEVPTAEEIASFVDERGVGIHDMQWHLGEQQFRVGRLSVQGYSRINWIATAALTPAERRTAKQFRVARDHQLV